MKDRIGQFLNKHTWLSIPLFLVALIGGGALLFDWLPEQPAFKYLHPAIVGAFTAVWGFAMIFGTYHMVGTFFDSESDFAKKHPPTRIGCMFAILCAIGVIVFILPNMGDEENDVPSKEIKFDRHDWNEFARLGLILLVPAWLGANAQISRNEKRHKQELKDRLVAQVLFEETGLRHSDLEARASHRLDYVDYTSELHDAARTGNVIMIDRVLADDRVCAIERDDPSWRFRYALWATQQYRFPEMGITVREHAYRKGFDLPAEGDDLNV